MLAVRLHVVPAHAQTKPQKQRQTPAQRAATQQAQFDAVSKAVAQSPDGSVPRSRRRQSLLDAPVSKLAPQMDSASAAATACT